MKNIFLVGECMVELMETSDNTMKQSFAGDVFNTAVYLKRAFPMIATDLITAVGQDHFSAAMVELFKRESIGCDYVFQSPDKIPGLYSIKTDSTGERSFTYWRENAAARDVMNHISQAVIAKLSKGDIFFFSGISLAVIRAEDRGLFWSLVEQLKKAGVKIVFDPNYRARMWDTQVQAQTQFELAFKYADIALPGVDDFAQLYGLTTAEQVHLFCQPFQFEELLIKNGEQGIMCDVAGEISHFGITPVTNVVDTTSAGDSFNGVYLGARAQGYTLADAITLASAAAGFVIQHKGAIVPADLFAQFLQEQPLLAKA